MRQTVSFKEIDIDALKAQVDAEIASRLQAEADFAHYIHMRGVVVGELKLLIGMDAASEVTEMPPLFRLPGAPSGVKGLANRHGRVVPVVDLPTLFGAVHESAANSWLLVYGHGDEAVGIIVDSLPDRKRFVPEDAIPIEEIAHPIALHARTAYRDGSEVWIDVDMEALFASVFQIEPAAT